MNNVEKDFFDKMEQVKSNTFESDVFSVDAIEEGYGDINKNLTNDHVFLLVDVLMRYPLISSVLLRGHNIADQGIERLFTIPHLNQLDISYNPITPNVFRHLTSDSLTTLMINGCITREQQNTQACKEMIDCLISKNSLTALHMNDCYISNYLLARLLKDCKNIKILTLGLEVQDSALLHIGSNEVLEYLYIPNNLLTTKSIRYISQNHSITELIICDSKINDEAVQLLIDHPTLKSLSIFDSDISFNAARKLIHAGNLDKLYIESTKDPHISSFHKWFAINQEFKILKEQKTNDNPYNTVCPVNLDDEIEVVGETTCSPEE